MWRPPHGTMRTHLMFDCWQLLHYEINALMHLQKLIFIGNKIKLNPDYCNPWNGSK